MIIFTFILLFGSSQTRSLISHERNCVTKRNFCFWLLFIRCHWLVIHINPYLYSSELGSIKSQTIKPRHGCHLFMRVGNLIVLSLNPRSPRVSTGGWSIMRGQLLLTGEYKSSPWWPTVAMLTPLPLIWLIWFIITSKLVSQQRKMRELVFRSSVMSRKMGRYVY